jgi:hypothetical protein
LTWNQPGLARQVQSSADAHPTAQSSHDDKMSKTEKIADLISECLDRCRMSGFTLATLVHFLDEIRKKGHSEREVQTVDSAMRHILTDILVPADPFAGDASALPQRADGGEPSKLVGF